MRSVFMRFFSGRNHAVGVAWVNMQNTPVTGDRRAGYSVRFAARISKMQQTINRKAAGSLREEQQEPANDRDVFRKIA
jgi:hypothetical protein